MFTINPFSELSGFISPIAMQVYVIAMVLLVAGGTVLDMIHKKSAQYFFKPRPPPLPASSLAPGSCSSEFTPATPPGIP